MEYESTQLGPQEGNRAKDAVSVHHRRTSYRKIAEMLQFASGIVADPACSFPATQRHVRAYIVAKSQGFITARNLGHVLGVEAVRCKSLQWTLVRLELPCRLRAGVL